jgi:hypothetical protein
MLAGDRNLNHDSGIAHWLVLIRPAVADFEVPGDRTDRK